MGRDSNYLELVLLRGEERTIVFTYKPADPALPPFDLTGKLAVFKIQHSGNQEITLTAPEITIPNPINGQIHLKPSGQTIQNFTFDIARFALLLDNLRLAWGGLEIKSIYE